MNRRNVKGDDNSCTKYNVQRRGKMKKANEINEYILKRIVRKKRRSFKKEIAKNVDFVLSNLLAGERVKSIFHGRYLNNQSVHNNFYMLFVVTPDRVFWGNALIGIIKTYDPEDIKDVKYVWEGDQPLVIIKTVDGDYLAAIESDATETIFVVSNFQNAISKINSTRTMARMDARLEQIRRTKEAIKMIRETEKLACEGKTAKEKKEIKEHFKAIREDFKQKVSDLEQQKD